MTLVAEHASLEGFKAGCEVLRFAHRSNFVPEVDLARRRHSRRADGARGSKQKTGPTAWEGSFRDRAPAVAERVHQQMPSL